MKSKYGNIKNMKELDAALVLLKEENSHKRETIKLRLETFSFLSVLTKILKRK
ncbi:MAG: hypothetical protein MJY71_06450 [Bacteroidaceae bacterium]|nr:hypothetical protein [Bacteroidaceae bacterium]